MRPNEIVEALRRAVAAAPDDVILRLHLAEQLLLAGDRTAATVEVATVIAADPGNERARALMTRALTADEPSPPAGRAPAPDPDAAVPIEPTDAGSTEFDWSAAEEQVGSGVADPLFGADSADAPAGGTAPAGSPADRFRIEPPDITLADVGGMQTVKDRLYAAFLAPMRNPELRARYAKSLRGGLLLYGPPGCGKKFIARALAGELGARFMSIGITDILDSFFGASERNMHEAFLVARREAPCVLFFDEVDALGARRSQTTNSFTRTAVNQLLIELDGIDGANEGVFVLAATNQPWDVDPAMRRPGRLDRTVLVLPPDERARAAIFDYHLRDRPLSGVDVPALARESEGLSGADIALVCESAAEVALLDGVRTGVVRDITQKDLRNGLRQAHPSTGPWLDAARNIVLFGDDDGTYAELRAYLKKAKRL